MSVVVVGLNHRHASLDQLERLSVSPEEASKALLSLVQRPHVGEAVVLSTCNRVEVYARVHRFHGGIADLRDFLCEWSGCAREELDGLTYEYHDERAAAHLFSVACGLDSVVVGERQVARQVKQAYLTARQEGSCGSQLGAVFERALRVARRVRTQTRLEHAASSMLDAGLDAALTHLGSLADRTVLLVGAGKIGTMAARRLEGSVGRLLVTNRTAEHAHRLTTHGATVVPLDELDRGVAAADLVITSTASPRPLIDGALLEPVMGDRSRRPLVIVDLAVPRDVAADCREVDDVVVLDVDAVASTVDSGPATDELANARAVVAEEVAALAAWQQARPVEPTITALRRQAEQIRRDELDRQATRLAGLDDRQRAAVEQATRGIINTLLHEPTVRLKAASGHDDDRWRAEVVRELFGLDHPSDD
ncbi:MAG: glutamyl-tRNA reductase [Actinobacteria bacterium]|nr:glutamyl-tRNA reductase [Actinomycetota bacterium]